MKLLELQLTNLFGIFNHSIQCNQDERITILTAPNGYGKTATLKVISNLFNKNFYFFHELPFEKIIFCFDDKKHLKVSKSKSGIKFDLNIGGKKDSEWTHKKNVSDKNYINRLNNSLPNYIFQIEDDEWLNELEGEILSTQEVVERFGGKLSDIPSKISSIIDSLEVYLIQEQRLVIRQTKPRRRFKQRDPVAIIAIQKHSNELSRLISQTTEEYAKKTQSLDSSFPKRLFKNNINAENLEDKLEQLKAKQKRISTFGLSDVQEDDFSWPKNIKEDKKVLSLYISDSEQKLSVFDSLVDRIELFVKILNERRFQFKSIEINKEDGFIFRDKNQEKLKPAELSSGEQHEVVLLFELLFNAKENSLVLIDEPEISLHVVWQKAFLDDIKEIIKLQKIDIIIATHSPQIINENWDLTTSLDA